MIGGVAFDNPESLEETGTRALEDHHFPLYGSRDQAHETTYLKKTRYLMFFEGSVRGLEVDAPVLLRGIKIGQVLDVKLRFNVEELEFLIPVLIEIEPERIGIIGDVGEFERQDVILRLVANGLRGQLKSGSLLTGALYVDLDFHPGAPKANVEEYGEYRVLPTLPAPLDALANKANDLLDTLRALPLEEIGRDLRDTVKGAKEVVTSDELSRSLAELELVLKQLRETARSLDKDALPELNAALRQARLTLKAAEGVVSPDSALYSELKRTLTELSSAARSIRVMADYLERHPEALIQGKQGL
jgi:paraquat-inducible protein B